MLMSPQDLRLDDEPVVSYTADVSQLTPERLAKLRMTPDEYLAMRSERVERERSAPKIGAQAPDFTLERLAADDSRTGEMFTLSSLKGQPVGLVFSSYT
jgi:hypothetical protein